MISWRIRKKHNIDIILYKYTRLLGAWTSFPSKPSDVTVMHSQGHLELLVPPENGIEQLFE
jgi:hypothetical protein